MARADYEDARAEFDEAISLLLASGSTDVVLYEGDTEARWKESCEKATELSRDLYGGAGLALPILPARSLSEARFLSTAGEIEYLRKDELHLSTSTFHDLTDWRTVLDAATEAGLELTT